jgi:hypothetical protein
MRKPRLLCIRAATTPLNRRTDAEACAACAVKTVGGSVRGSASGDLEQPAKITAAETNAAIRIGVQFHKAGRKSGREAGVTLFFLIGAPKND